MAAARIPFFVLAFAFLLGTALATTLDQHESIKFTYSGATYPDKWGTLSPQFSACSNGKSQSPVNIVKKEAVIDHNLKPLGRHYNPANATLVNHGVNIGVTYDRNVGVMTVDGKNYTLKQMHWHSPSEHHINGVQYPAELHQVHMADDGNFSVVSVLYRYGNADPFISKLMGKLKELAKEACLEHEQAQIPLGIMNVKHIKRNTRKYYRYVGSLTTPPCTEHIIWNVLGKVRSISKEQVAALTAPLEAACKNNSRPIQALNGRHIQLYDELRNN
ncbi:hypothetical protein L1049_008173 [Liquidambar formosana]|uniref:Alpha-carbonic anhydrase domain-containing protein n=1 Tax=Liquidambar formosana TaxID=63359 RepID=A0AAP0S397_LIQFO